LNKIRNNIPNIITLLNLTAGAVSVSFSAVGNFYIATILILVAAIFDFFDGFFARILGAYSPIGKQLDSLADIVSFGFAPAFLLHVFLKKMIIPGFLMVEISFIDLSKLLIILSPFLLTIFAAVRLAVFNIDTKQNSRFIGLPVPAVALFFISLIISLEMQTIDLYIHEINWVLMILVFSVLMVISFPMFSLKFDNYQWKGNEIRYIFIGISLILLVTLQTIGISLAIILYIFLSGLMNVLHLNSDSQ
jgi:CDP-diacylglycerol--serine O-phosphatidyltransferase